MNPPVLLLHGIWNARAWVGPLAWRLRARGFAVHTFGYSSVWGGPDVAVPQLLERLKDCGAVSLVGAAREPNGKLRLRRSDATGKSIEAPIDSAGAQIALADLDLDGTPEIAFSADSTDNDALAVWSWRANGLVQRLRYPAKEGVRAIAACPPEEKGLPALVAVVGSEIWLVR